MRLLSAKRQRRYNRKVEKRLEAEKKALEIRMASRPTRADMERKARSLRIRAGKSGPFSSPKESARASKRAGCQYPQFTVWAAQYDGRLPLNAGASLVNSAQRRARIAARIAAGAPQ